ncbi:nuclear transport factor 2-like protein [Catelliglobosispora koreensis]|uniref:hypothetical protein n=1 Tax=Catelliglobosispora koreensis TaxID=129052 RepID=UPI00035F02ED|nr:hypothetical protein [Catelliglobosispora koreensis]
MSPVDTFLAAVTTATIPGCTAWAEDAVLDATVPNWRMRRRGAERIRAEFAKWYADPGKFEELSRVAIEPGTELVRFMLTWTEHGVPHAAHQAHVIRMSADRIADHVVYCGGRWPAGLLAQMAEAADD